MLYKNIWVKLIINNKLQSQGGSLTCEGRNDASEFAAIKSAMIVLNFPESQINEINKMLAVILHIGNIKYQPCLIGNFIFKLYCI